MKSLSLVVYNRGIFSLRNEWASRSSEHFWERKRGERKCLAWSADSPLFTYFLGIQKISQLCCDRIPIHVVTAVSLHSLKHLTNLTAQNNFTDRTGLIYTLNGFPRYVCADNLTCSFSVNFLLMWNNPWTMCKHFEWTRTMPQLRSDCSSVCSQVTHRSWRFASRESDRWKYIIRDFAVVAIVKFFTLLHTLLENSD